MAYRTTRNFEASTIDFLQEIFAQSGGWSNITVEKTFKRVYGIPMDSNTGAAAVCVRVLRTNIKKAQIGNDAIYREALVMLDIFATSDGQREDLKDYIIQYIKYGIPYYQYTVVGQNVTSKILAGHMRIASIEDTPVNFNTDKSSLDIHDRYRHALSITVCTGQIEE